MINSVSTAANTTGSDNIIDGVVTITEKLDVFRFTFEKTSDGVNFFKKDSTPINIIERTLTDMWEDAIYDITESVKNLDLPIGAIFGVSYCPVERPLRIPYPNLHKYILTDVTIKDRRNKKALSEDKVLEWANKIGIGTPPIIFKGVLDDVQKSVLISYDRRDFEHIKQVDFASIIENLLGGSYSKGDILEGIVITNSDNKPLQIESHEFSLLRESYDKMQPNKVLYDMVMIHMSKHLDSTMITESEGVGEYRYIDVVCKVFNDFIDNNNIIDGIKESDLSPVHFGHKGNLNTTWIKNNKTLSLIKESKINESLFKIFLNALRKEKRCNGLINENVANNINTFTRMLRESCYGSIYESQSDNALVNNIGDRRTSSDMDSMKVISSMQLAFNTESKEIDNGIESVIVFVSKFNPISTSEYVLMEQLHNQYNANIVLCHYNTSNSLSSDVYIISDNLVNAQMKSLVDNVHFIIDSISLDNDSLTEIFKKCRPKYEPMLMCCTNNSSSDYINQLYFNEQVKGGNIGVMDSFNIIEQENGDEITIMQIIETEDAVEFKNYTPKCTHWLWNNISNEYKIWLGSILTNKPQL